MTKIKMTLDKLDAIREERRAGTTFSELAEKYGMSKPTIHRWVKDIIPEYDPDKKSKKRSRLPTDTELLKLYYAGKTYAEIARTFGSYASNVSEAIKLALKKQGLPRRPRIAAKSKQKKYVNERVGRWRERHNIKTFCVQIEAEVRDSIDLICVTQDEPRRELIGRLVRAELARLDLACPVRNEKPG